VKVLMVIPESSEIVREADSAQQAARLWVIWDTQKTIRFATTRIHPPGFA
jgi:hypothetical protein